MIWTTSSVGRLRTGWLSEQNWGKEPELILQLCDCGELATSERDADLLWEFIAELQ